MSDVAATHLSRLLRLYRAANDLGVRECAAAIGISPATLSRIERGHVMDLSTWLKVQAWLLA